MTSEMLPKLPPEVFDGAVGSKANGCDLPPRPGTAGRPGTASRRASGFGYSKYESPDEFISNSTAILQQQVESDSLLKIMKEKDTSSENRAIIYVEKGDTEGMRSLIDIGVNLGAVKGLDGFSLLHYACNRGHALVVAELLRYHVDINAKNDSGETPLHLAVYSGNMLIVEQLLDRGASINAGNGYGETALFYAARKSYPALVRLLIQRGADVEVRDQFGDTAVDHCGNDHTERSFNARALSLDLVDTVPYAELLHVFTFLCAKELGRSACVSGKWHRISETESLWTRLKVRRWECALQSSLGFSPPAMASFKVGRPRPQSKLTSGREAKTSASGGEYKSGFTKK
jgi:hypothetical protein